MKLYTFAEVNALRPQALAILENLRRAVPLAWANAHNRQEPSGSEFNRRAVLELRAAGMNVAVNGKRGNPRDLSQDILAFPVLSGGAPDATRTVPGLALIDFIIGAGASGASLGWIDQTQPTIEGGTGGAWVEPWLEPLEQGAAAPAPTPAPPAPPVDLTPLRLQLDALAAAMVTHRVEEGARHVEARDRHDDVLIRLDNRVQYLADHLDDLKARVDAGFAAQAKRRACRFL